LLTEEENWLNCPKRLVGQRRENGGAIDHSSGVTQGVRSVDQNKAENYVGRGKMKVSLNDGENKCSKTSSVKGMSSEGMAGRLKEILSTARNDDYSDTHGRQVERGTGGGVKKRGGCEVKKEIKWMEREETRR